MKLPKPKKLNLPKPGKDKSPGEDGNSSKLGRFHIKNRFLQKNLMSLIVAAVLLIGTGTVYGTLSSSDADMGVDPVNGVNQDRFQVLVSGNGYKLSKEQEKNYKLQKKQNKVNAANAMQNPNTITNPNSSRTFHSSSSHRSYRYRYSGSTYKPSKNPRLSSDISSEIKKLENPVKGDTFKIKVTALAYPYGTKNVIPSENVEVKVVSDNGGSASLYKSDEGSHYYKIELGEGKNSITITATDTKNKKTAKLGPYTVKNVGAGNSSTNTDPTQGTADPGTEEINKPVTASADLSDWGLGTVSFDGVVVKKDSTAADVLSKIDGIKMDGQDIEYISGDMGSFSLDGSSSEVQNIYKKVCNVTGEIEESEYASWLDEMESVVKDSGKLGKNYPFSKTKWTYDNSKTGEDLANSGITLTLILYDD